MSPSLPAIIASRPSMAILNHKLAHKYQFRVGVPRNLHETVRLYRLSAEQGVVLAHLHLGELLLRAAPAGVVLGGRHGVVLEAYPPPPPPPPPTGASAALLATASEAGAAAAHAQFMMSEGARWLAQATADE
mmetsp:Transcript_4980/g.11928  ORF Transcript_4980/g.11928 Transcript_4980/m.11928 type:complete len:132 (+) Transcript_4980:213-608(+)